MEKFIHSVTLDKDLCKGCINCIKRCPTEAIRVRDGKAHILAERCIDCGECIRICPHHAKKPLYDPLTILDDFKYTIALPPPSLYGQYNNLEEQDVVLAALLDMGFDDVYEVAKAAELVSDATRRILQTGSIERPVISSACPAVTRLIRVRFPQLIDHVLPLVAPIELAARSAKKEAVRRTGLPKEDIGCIFITPCPAKVTAIHSPIGSSRSEVDGAVAIKEVYPRLLASMKRISQMDYLASAGRIGLGWAESGGEAAGLISTDSYLAADGIENVIRVLEDLEDEKIPGPGLCRAGRLCGRLRGRRAAGGKPVHRKSEDQTPAALRACEQEPSFGQHSHGDAVGHRPYLCSRTGAGRYAYRTV